MGPGERDEGNPDVSHQRSPSMAWPIHTVRLYEKQLRSAKYLSLVVVHHSICTTVHACVLCIGVCVCMCALFYPRQRLNPNSSSPTLQGPFVGLCSAVGKKKRSQTPAPNVHHFHFVNIAFVLHIHRRENEWGSLYPSVHAWEGVLSLWHPPRCNLVTGGRLLWPTTGWD